MSVGGKVWKKARLVLGSATVVLLLLSLAVPVVLADPPVKQTPGVPQPGKEWSSASIQVILSLVSYNLLTSRAGRA